MTTCSYCNTENDGDFNFCENCERQIKCLHCGSVLKAMKSLCLRCGKRIEDGGDSTTPVNKFTLEEKHTTKSSYRKIEGQFSDNAFGQAAALFGGLPQARPSQPSQPRIVPTPSRPTLPLHEHSPKDTETEPEVQLDEVVDSPEVRQVISQAIPTNLDRARRYFDIDGESELVARMSDFKGQNKQEQQKRFMILYVWAYQHILGKPEPSKKVIISALTKKGFFDSNAYKHFSNIENKYFSKAGSGYKINLDGEKEVEHIISEIENDTIRGFQDWDKVKTREKGVRLSKDMDDQVNTWVDTPVDINGFDVRKLKKPTNYAMFGIWVVTTKIGGVKALKPVEIFNYLKRKYTHVPVTQRSLSVSLVRSYNASIFEKTSDGSFYLTHEAEKKVASWVQGGQVDDQPEQDALGNDEDEE